MTKRLPFWIFFVWFVTVPRFEPKLKVPKWVCRSPLVSFCNGPPLFAIFGPARGQIYGKTAEKIPKKSCKNKGKIAFLDVLYRDTTQKVIQDHPSTLGLAGEHPNDGGRWDDVDGRTKDRDSDDGSGRSPSKSQAARMVLHDFLRGILI